METTPQLVRIDTIQTGPELAAEWMKERSTPPTGSTPKPLSFVTMIWMEMTKMTTKTKIRGLHEGVDDIDNNDIESMDFDIDYLKSDNSHSDGNDGGGDGDFAILEFNEVMIRPNKARHVHQKDPIEGTSFGSLSAK